MLTVKQLEWVSEQDWFIEAVTDGCGGWLLFVEGLKYPLKPEELKLFKITIPNI